MREIKFRVYFPNQSHFEYFTLQALISNRVPDPWKLALVAYPEYKKDQYTGLKDKNGAEIYEGDIVDWNLHPLLSTPEVVELAIAVDCNGQDVVAYNPGLQYSRVTGNIYENPELLGDDNGKS